MFKITLPYPPSVNSTYKMGNGNFYSSKKLKDYKEVVRVLIMAANAPNFTLAERLSVTLTMYPPDNRRRDIDNPIKGNFDALTKAGVWEDDCQVKRLLVLMKEKHPPLGKIEVEIEVI